MTGATVLQDPLPGSEADEGRGSWMSLAQVEVESALDAALAPADEKPGVLHEAMRYAVLGGGKRIRPLLVVAAAIAIDGGPSSVGSATMAGAVAVELIHAYSLVHDDMPAMDNDVLRRGKPTVHVKFGEATALLVGDALQALAFEVLGTVADERADRLGMVARLARAAGSRGMAGGQAIDLASVGASLPVAELEFMHRAKTGAILEASVAMGAMSVGAGRDDLAALERYGRAIGLAFQIVDDILDVETDTATLGKTAGKDAGQNKPTYVSALGIGPARDRARALHEEAIGSIAALGERGRRLRQLADLIIMRKN